MPFLQDLQFIFTLVSGWANLTFTTQLNSSFGFHEQNVAIEHNTDKVNSTKILARSIALFGN